VAVTLPAQSSPDATPSDEIPFDAHPSDDASSDEALSHAAIEDPSLSAADRGMSSPAAFIGVVAVTTLVIILCVLGATMSGLFGSLSGADPDGQPAAAQTDATQPIRGPVDTFDDGQWAVGLDVKAGTYATTVPAGSAGCTWERKESTDGSAFSVLESGVGAVGDKLVVDIKATDKVFQSSGCGRWQRTE
jgi:hypothetical protein